MFLICLEKVLQGLKAVEMQQMHGIYLEHNNRFMLFFHAWNSPGCPNQYTGLQNAVAMAVCNEPRKSEKFWILDPLKGQKMHTRVPFVLPNYP